MKDASGGNPDGGLEPILGPHDDWTMCNTDASYDLNLAVLVTDEGGKPICGASVRATNQSGWDQELMADWEETPGLYWAGEFYGFVRVDAVKAGYGRAGARVTLDQCSRERGRLQITLRPAVDGGTPDPGCDTIDGGGEAPRAN